MDDFKIGQLVWYKGFYYKVERIFTKPSTFGKIEIRREVSENESFGHILQSCVGIQYCKIGTYLYG